MLHYLEVHQKHKFLLFFGFILGTKFEIVHFGEAI